MKQQLRYLKTVTVGLRAGITVFHNPVPNLKRGAVIRLKVGGNSLGAGANYRPPWGEFPPSWAPQSGWTLELGVALTTTMMLVGASPAVSGGSVRLPRQIMSLVEIGLMLKPEMPKGLEMANELAKVWDKSTAWVPV